MARTLIASLSGLGLSNLPEVLTSAGVSQLLVLDTAQAYASHAESVLRQLPTLLQQRPSLDVTYGLLTPDQTVQSRPPELVRELIAKGLGRFDGSGSQVVPGTIGVASWGAGASSTVVAESLKTVQQLGGSLSAADDQLGCPASKGCLQGF